MAVFGWPFPVTVEQPAQFSLYGDGLAIYTVEHQPTGTVARTFELLQARLTDRQVDAMLRYALESGGLATAAERYDDVTITDMPTTVFEVHAGGYDKTVSVYALGDMGTDAPSAPERARFLHLAINWWGSQPT